MRRELSSIFHPGLITALAISLVVLALPLQSCLEPLSETCPSGLVCPVGQKCAANEDVCITNNCGDNIVQPGELCDDGNIRGGDGCNETCDSKEVCGNGITDKSAGEKCDDGDNEREGGCSANCLSFETCGNGNVDPLEQCDSHSVDTKYCNHDCTITHCGDGYTNSTAGEECDYKGHESECNLNCTISKCGDGITNTADDEECDSGGVDTKYCNHSTCTISRCGDGYVNKAAGEQCDPKFNNACNLDCTPSNCGNGTVDTRAGEVCDDGNHLACGTCNSDCTQSQELMAATGFISIVHSSKINDGQTITINDGKTEFLLEFNKDFSCSGEGACINLFIDPFTAKTARQLAIDVKTAINNKTGFMIQASLPNNSTVVTLKNDNKGTSGNIYINTTIEHEDFSVNGMSGGIGEACGEGDPCKTADDCEYALQCKGGRCTH